MAPRRGKATGAASGAKAAAPRVSAPRVKGAPTEPRESPAVPEAARPSARRCGPARPSGSRREKSGPDSQEKRQVRTRAARAEDQAEGPAARTEGVMPPAAPGRPLPRPASRREGTARSARERRPQPGPTEVPGPLVPVPSLGRGKEAPGAWKPRAVLEKLRLSRLEISAATEVVNSITDHLLRRLQSSKSEFKGVALLRTGSYYERVKISAPNEFDVMFKLEVPRIQLEEYCNSAAHYFVKFKRNPKGNPLGQFLEGEILSASKMLSKFRKIIKEEIKNIEEETWRLSFSHIEKEILKNHGQSKTCCEIDGVKCCRKECLKLMKYLLEQLKKKFGNRKELDKFCSYHVKTAFFHVCTQDPDDSQWQSKDLELCFDNCVTYFLQCLQTEQLEHYFIPEVNLFSRDHIDKLSKEFLSKQIEYERNNGFPVFGEF
ncbi:cyclic GMP-AMP synthase isoform X2 [Mesoplodon densirostris]|uniref:cyclic GMP-AMP synthase isoform X2 n=1 Tax=Mesoplodon densirostris TaxID=48708 RepID=UPI0028DB859F|nr:cyclic GMP-AMP synthase isoform X2 [Mesoplodon densirostris]